MKANSASVWLRAAAICLIVLGAAFAVYGRLVRVETRLAELERKVEAIHARLFRTSVAEKP